MVAEFSGSREQAFHTTIQVDKQDIVPPDSTVADIEKKLLGIGDQAQREAGIPREDIRAYAQRIADMYQEQSQGKEGYKMIIDALNTQSVIEQIMSTEEYRTYLDELSVKEIQEAVDGLRKAVIHELSNLLEPDVFAFLLEKIKLPWEAGASRVDLIQGRSEEVQILRRNELPTSPERTDALKRYTALPPHPCLLPIKEFGAGGMAVMVDKLDLVTLGDVLAGKSHEKFSPSELLQVILGSASGLLYLEQHGLMLQDICPDNVGVNRKTRRAVMFDLDGLFPLGVESKQRLMKREYIPPELFNTQRVPITDAEEMVYQLGEVFDRLRSTGFFVKGLPMSNKLEFLFRNALFDLAYDMKKTDPKTRISLGEVVDRTKGLVHMTSRMEELLREHSGCVIPFRPRSTKRPSSDRMAI